MMNGVSLTAFHSVAPVVCRCCQVWLSVWWAGAGLWAVVVLRACGCSWACDPCLMRLRVMMMVIVVPAVVICMHHEVEYWKGISMLSVWWICVAGDGVLAGRRSHLAGWWVVSREAGEAVERFLSGICSSLTGDDHCGGG